MAYGIILFDWDKQKGPIIAGSYFEKKIDIEQNFATRTFLAHAATGWDKENVQKQLYLQFNEITMVSHYFSIEEDAMVRRVVLAIVLRNDEKPEQHFEIIKEFAPNIIEKINLSRKEIEQLLKKIYKEKIQNISAKFTVEDLKNMIPLLKGKLNETQILDNFGELGVRVLKNLPQSLKIEKLAHTFNASVEEITNILIWAAEEGYVQLLKL